MITSSPQSHSPSTRLLLVEDEVYVRQFLTIGLELEGYKVTAAENGQEALTWISGEGLGQVDVVVADLMMPVLDGLAFLRRLRGELRCPVPVLILTAVNLSEVLEEIAAAGANAAVQKPADIQEIVRELRRLTCGREAA